MIAGQFISANSNNHMLEAAWAALEAANDLRDAATVETCRRVIDANLSGNIPSKSDIDVIFNFF
jgi:hypothetical protein